MSIVSIGVSDTSCLFSSCRAYEETQQLEVEKALVLTNQGSVMWRQEKVNKFTRGQVVSDDLSQNVVAVCGVVLSTIVPRQVEQVYAAICSQQSNNCL